MRLSIFFTGLMIFYSASGNGQVPVSEEPRHHKVLDNGHVRLLDVHIPPGDTSQFHIHATPSVFLLLTGANTGTEIISEEDQSKSPVRHYGNIWFEGFYVKPRIHRVFNRDSHEFRVMDIELTNKNYIELEPPIKNSSFVLLFEEKPVRAYRLLSDGKDSLFLPPRKGDMLMILLSDTVSPVRVNKKTFLHKGDFLYLPAGTGFELSSTGRPNFEFALFELK
jgi:hypothetical protein